MFFKNWQFTESGKNFITWAWPASTTIIYNKPNCGI
jgi:hypothetical protein